MFLILVVQAGDVAQQVCGLVPGRWQAAPAASPGKTGAGFACGAGAAVLAGSGLFWITPFTIWQAGALALVIVTMGFLGKMVMSAIKRDRGVRDWGCLPGGHGGVTDRLDSVIFAAPVFFHLVRYWWSLT